MDTREGKLRSSLKKVQCAVTCVVLVPKLNKSLDEFSTILTQLVYSVGSFSSKKCNLMNVKFVLFPLRE